MALSNKRRQHALLSGEAWAKGMLKIFIEDPSYFPKGAESLYDFVPRAARSHLAMNCTHKPSQEEEDLAQKGAADLIRLALDFAEKVPENP